MNLLSKFSMFRKSARPPINGAAAPAAMAAAAAHMQASSVSSTPAPSTNAAATPAATPPAAFPPVMAPPLVPPPVVARPPEVSAPPVQPLPLAATASEASDLTSLLAAIKEQVDSERAKIAPRFDGGMPHMPSMASAVPDGVAIALHSYEQEARVKTLSENTQVNRLRSALSDVSQAMRSVVDSLPAPSLDPSTWEEIVAELEGLAEKQRRLDEIQKAFDATIQEVEEAFTHIHAHIERAIRDEHDCVETYQKRIRVAEGLLRLLRR